MKRISASDNGAAVSSRDTIVTSKAFVYASYHMDKIHNDLMWYVIHKYQTTGEVELRIDCADVASDFGLDPNYAYKSVKAAAYGLQSTKIVFPIDEAADKQDISVNFLRWVKSPGKRGGCVYVKIEDLIVPHIKKFIENGNFTKHDYETIAQLDSFSGRRLYQLCKAKNFGTHARDGWEMLFEELREHFGAFVMLDDGTVLYDVYGEWYDFKRRLLDDAVKRVNDTCDFNVAYELKKKGRAVHAVRFYVTPKVAADAVATLPDEELHENLVTRMLLLKVNRNAVNKIYKEFGKSDRARIEYALNQTEMAMKAGKAKDPAAYFVAAVKRNDRAKGPLLTEAQKARERELDAKERAIDKQRRERVHDGADDIGFELDLKKYERHSAGMSDR